MLRSLIAATIFGLAGTTAIAQQAGPNTSHTSPSTAQAEAAFPSKPELLRRIALYEAAARSAEAAKAASETRVKLYLELGGLYEDAAMYPKSEDAIRRAISLLRTEPPHTDPQDQLAAAIGHLAVLHIAMGELREAEKEQLDALQIRERIGDPIGTAQTWSDLADVYIKQKQYKLAADYAQRAMQVLGNDPSVDITDRIAVRQTLAYALSGEKDFTHAIPLLKDAIELAISSYGADSLQAGVGYYLLGYTSWQAGNTQDAAQWMQRGTARMKVDMGWGHPVYVNAMSQYAKFLRQRGQTQAAAAAEREVLQAQTVVDARSFTGRPVGMASAGLR